ncbi:VWA domain-containing protein [Sporosarcina sp. 179-K 8C2 HS]|uniref:VWA domain-containing protein n=1 Tax=Sporosarcina sp. 179-K 8C2 HS TaxID=3142387 RepID=UPI0039A00821
MRKVVFSVFIGFTILLAGCVNDGEPSKIEASDGESNSTVSSKEKQGEVGGNEQQSDTVDVTNLASIQIAETVEEMASLPPGQLTKDFTVDQETSVWSKTEVPEQIRESFLEEMKAVTEETEDPKQIHRAFIKLLGSPIYNEYAGPLAVFHPSFAEPILPEPYELTEVGVAQSPPTKALILLDASSSMLLQADGRLKMDIAKSAVKSFASTIGQNSEVSLYVYGHAGTQNKSDKQLSCGTIDEVYPLGEYDEKKFNESVEDVKASGWTPLAEAIKQARLDHEKTSEDITVYIVSDGAETCGGDPVAEAKAFAALAADHHVNVIGFQVDKDAESQLKAVAEAGNGTYLAADSLDEMTAGISKLWLPSDIDLATLVYKKPVGWPQAMALRTVSDYGSKLIRAIRVENERFTAAAKLLEEEGFIDAAVRDELKKLIDKQKEQYSRLVNELEEEKRQLINNEVERINKKVDDYYDRMKALKEEQSQ